MEYCPKLANGSTRMCLLETFHPPQQRLLQEQSSWEKPLVVAFKHSEGIKHKVLFQEQKLTNYTKAYNTHPLFLSSVSLYSLHTK